jgi:hypothetical protein
LLPSCADPLIYRRKKTPQSGVFFDPSGFHRMNAITWKQMRQQLEPMRQQQEQRQEPMRQQQERQQLALEQELQLLFYRMRTKQLQR